MNCYKLDQFPRKPIVFKIKSIIKNDPQTRNNPMTAHLIISLPLPNMPGSPAEAIIKIAPTISAITASGVAIILTIKS